MAIHVKVPATSANMGPGFDAIGMAFQMYNQIWVEEQENSDKSVTIECKNKTDFPIPQDESNLIYQSMLMFHEYSGVKRTWGNIRIVQEDDIPFTRGLGSSAACIVAGLCAANQLSGSPLGRKELAEIAAKIEGHPDNSTPAILGGMVVGAMKDGVLDYIKMDTSKMVADGLRFGVMIPSFPLATEKARAVLPKTFTMEQMVWNASRTALLVAAVLTGDYDKLMTGMDDCVHQPYRKNIIPNMEDIFSKAKALGAKGIFLSGAGPTIVSIYEEKNAPFVEEMKNYLGTLPDCWDFHILNPDWDGVQVSVV